MGHFARSGRTMPHLRAPTLCLRSAVSQTVSFVQSLFALDIDIKDERLGSSERGNAQNAFRPCL